MLLEANDAGLFFKLHAALMQFVNRRLKVIPETVIRPGEFTAVSAEKRVMVRDALTANLDLIQLFVEENPADLSAEELEIVLSWRHMVGGQFYVY